ncbi:hypothetical protein [Arthrobacter sp. ov118]|jgi:hypothetical protein|uniref:hypothetical protein n=1 Tax=Arthrobacter sp. ov118 TaxID=1761747 RepID=UPI0008E1E112|nr:hypothetical protein [Arthrobacter sp. ov118]SFU03039.1 hypothetical protein SAMN04487915_108102 [Arthrobacter sp. ov118]
MIAYRPVAPLTTGRPGLVSAFAAMALTAVLGTTWQRANETSAAPDQTPETAETACPPPAGGNRL